MTPYNPFPPTNNALPPGQSALRRGRANPEPGHTWLITTCTWRRQRIFTEWLVGRVVVREMWRLEQAGGIRSLAWVVMPDHWHWLLQFEESKATPAHLPELMRSAKGRSAFAINRLLQRRGPVWQASYHDHALRQEEDIEAIARYVIANPVRAGLAASIGDYALWDSAWDVGDIVEMGK